MPHRILFALFFAVTGLTHLQAAPALLPQPKAIRVGQGHVSIHAGSRIVAQVAVLEPLAKVFASDIQRVHGLRLPIASTPAAGDVVLRLVANDPKLKGPDAHRVLVDDKATIEGGSYQAVAFGMMTVLQAMERDGDGLKIARMNVEDDADRPLRALQVSIRGGYHSPEWVKKIIDLMRFYKVRVLQLHTTEALWVGAVMNSSNGADPKLLREQAAWSIREMDDVIAYARQRGVCLLPHNEMRPNDPLWRAALTRKFNPHAAAACYVDEIDHQGRYEIKGNLADDPRFWSFVKAVTQRSYDQFAKGWPGGKLPYYHIGPVYGEGGCSGKEAVRMLGFLREKNPDIKMMYWNGPDNANPDLAPHRKNLLVDFYSVTWGGTPEGLLAAGYGLCNVSWAPLYVQPGSRIKAERQGKWIFDEFHLSRFGNAAAVGEPIRDVRDCSARPEGILGSMLATWDFADPNDREGHLEMILPCIPYYAEHAWNVRPWPYPAGAWEQASAAFARLAPLAERLVCDDRPSSAPTAVTATQGVLPAAVDIYWAESDNFPQYYQVYRADAADPVKARPISGKIPASFVTRLNAFRDDKVQPDRPYFYWVRSFNPAGPSEFGPATKGFTGPGVAMPMACESFDYPAGTPLDRLPGGSSFRTPWKVLELNSPLTIAPNGLTYPGLKTSGRALHVEATDSDETGRRRPPHIRIERALAATYGHDGTQLWTSFLLRAQRAEVGEIAAHIGRMSVGKGWGDSLWPGGGRMKPNKTYLIVARYTFHKGNDLLHMWVDPVPGRQPADTDAVAATRQEDNPASDVFSIHMQPYGKGSYDLDEIHVGASYAEVAPVLTDSP